MRQGFYERNHWRLQGNARFVDEHTLALDCPDGSVETLTAEKIAYCLRLSVHIIQQMLISPIHAFTTATQFSACTTNGAMYLSMVLE